MPPQGSRLDRILLRAEGLADASAKLMAAINLDQDLQREVLNIPMNCFGYLLQVSDNKRNDYDLDLSDGINYRSVSSRQALSYRKLLAYSTR